ncbi:MAG: ADP-ribose diphosphatase [Gammaproteobacteria bacterium]|nr:ADP-ribose diphosphatase [Gammaproteobacteria bacterium]
MARCIIFGLFGGRMADWPEPTFGCTDWTLEAAERLADGFFQLDELRLTHRGYQRESVGPMRRELLVRKPAIVAILCDLNRRQVAMVEQFRVGPAMSELDESPWMLEWVAGICEANELPLETCHREVFEETGLSLDVDPQLIFTYFPSPGGSNELIFLYFAPCDLTRVERFRGQTGEHEDLKVHVISIASALEALQTKKMNNAATIIGLQWLQLNLPG